MSRGNLHHRDVGLLRRIQNINGSEDIYFRSLVFRAENLRRSQHPGQIDDAISPCNSIKDLLPVSDIIWAVESMRHFALQNELSAHLFANKAKSACNNDVSHASSFFLVDIHALRLPL